MPLSAEFSTMELQQIEIRGEVLMNKKDFKEYNDKLWKQAVHRWQIPEMLQQEAFV